MNHSKPKLLIVDDEADQQELMSQAFLSKPKFRHYEFLYAANGKLALDQIQETDDIEIILLDINMPVMDGLSLLEIIHNRNPEIIAVIISAYNDMNNIRRAMNHGAYDFVTKPLDIRDLEVTLLKTIQYSSQLKEIKKTIEENNRLKEKSLDLEMKVLRSQMNPHFIFNSLNSIHHFILKQDVDLAGSYLLKFSKLIRAILDHSRQDMISLKDELMSLEWYIQLEALRADQKFNFVINVSNEVDTMYVKVPPLILQPFVENAIQHGLMTKQGKGFLSLEVLAKNGNVNVIIADDGVGRINSRKKTNNPEHKSVGIEITQERIQRGFGLASSASVEMKDLYESDCENPGTQVIIQFPIYYDQSNNHR